MRKGDIINAFLAVALLIGIAAVIITVVIIATKVMAGREILQGRAYVVDGDTIKIMGQSIRLKGIDAEEMNERNGPAAREAMIAVIADGIVTCRDTGERSYKRIVAYCHNAAGDDIGAALVRMGAVLDCARYSLGAYRSLEPDGIRSKLIQKRYC